MKNNLLQQLKENAQKEFEENIIKGNNISGRYNEECLFEANSDDVKNLIDTFITKAYEEGRQSITIKELIKLWKEYCEYIDSENKKEYEEVIEVNKKLELTNLILKQ